MDRPSYDSRQIMVRRNWLGRYVLMVRDTYPASAAGDWTWSRWRRATDMDAFNINIILRKFWK